VREKSILKWYSIVPRQEGIIVMVKPIAHIDPRFSDPGVPATNWEETRRILQEAELFWITTVRDDGRPHTTPLVAVWFEDAIYFATGDTEQKARNVQKNQQIILMTGCNSWDAGLDVIVEGEAKQVTDNEQLSRLARVWATKWDGRWHFEGRDGGFYHQDGGMALVFEVRPTKVLAFAKGSFAQTCYRF
jgi:general stress protein 26